MRISDRRWRALAIIPAVVGALLTFSETLAVAGGSAVPDLAGVPASFVGVVLIVIGLVLLVVSQRAAAKESAGGPGSGPGSGPL